LAKRRGSVLECGSPCRFTDPCLGQQKGNMDGQDFLN
jgi:hypothetical protein